ncbi:MAG TPA: hypothetical protein VFV07_02385 [Rhizomicrobium sp.]|nr:hypothetical protein [Rhizomicrobium sp.]
MHRFKLAAAAALLALAATPAFAQDKALIDYVPRQQPPPNVPADMNVTCANTPEFTALAAKCPVIRYQGMTTWVLSYKDNRWSMALVTYDANNKIVRNVEHKGARYIVNAVSSPKTQTVTISGQNNKIVTVPWSELGK